MGLDLSLTSTGIEVLDSLGSRVYGGLVGKELKKATERDRVERLVLIANTIIGLVKEHDVRHVAIEGYAYSKKYGGEKLAELHGVVKTQLYLACGLIAEPVSPRKARRVVFGQGKGGIKKKMVQPLLEQRGIFIENGDQRDAYVVARYKLWRAANGEGQQRRVDKRKRRRRNRDG